MKPTSACFLVLAGLWVIPAVASAQGSFAGIGIHPGDVVRVTVAATGDRTKGEVETITPDLIRIDGVDFTPSSVSRVERAGDPVWDGAILGGLFGVLASTSRSESCLDQTARQCLIGNVVAWGLVGTTIDYMHDRYTTVYPQVTRMRSARVAPWWARGAGGIAVRLRFR